MKELYRSELASLAKTALRLVFFRPVAEEDVAVSWMQVVALVLISLIPPTLYDAITIGADGHASWRTLPEALYHVPVMLFAAVVLANLVDEARLVATIMAAALLAWTFIDFAVLGVWLGAGDAVKSKLAADAFFYIPLAWVALAIARFAMALLPSSSARRGLVLLASAIFLAAPLMLKRERSLWTYDYSRSDPRAEAMRQERMAAGGEDAFYKQPELLKHALDEVKPGRKGVVDVYFVGMAGYGYQDVFMREVDSVATLFRERYHADGHIVKLINNPKTVMSQPIASATSLRATLKRVAEVMDRDEDVLVLFLTSHGSQDHRFSLTLWPLELTQITPQMLRGLLDESGIRNRVVIVSACYAGGFVNSLSNDDTVVIAAAAPDRNSFGCSSTNQWTYFGKAYFDEALRKTTSFTQAFEIARPVIEQREKSEKFDPSMPQMYAGSAIKAKLETLDRQLASGTPAAPADEPRLAAADKAERYVGLLFEANMAKSNYESCKHEMELNGPEKSLERSPESMGGLNHSSPQWPRFVAAWDRYTEEACSKVNDPAIYRAAYLRVVRETMTDKDLDIALRMLSSGEGHLWYEKEKVVRTALDKRLVEAQRSISEPLYAEYLRERDKIYADFSRK